VNEEAWTLGVTAPRSAEGRKLANYPYPLPSGRKPGSAPAGRQPSKRGALSGQHEAPRAARQWPPAFTEVMREEGAAEFPCALDAGAPLKAPLYTYLRDPDEIRRRSFALVRKEADLSQFPAAIRGLAARLAHAAGDASILADLASSRGAVAAGKRALAAGATILVDSQMVAAGIARDRLRAANPILCTLHAPATKELAMALGTTRSAAAVELWREALAGAIVAIGNAPTALFRLLELIAAGERRPALILGFPVGFVGAAEAKQALAEFGRGLGYITLKGRRGGSALAAAAVNALAEAAA
jgi:precorrin-8X/cobalt-precorrin-8 methylmutase